jgi:hypothetical protein
MKLKVVLFKSIFIILIGMPCAKVFAFDKEIELKPLKKTNFEHLSFLGIDSIPVKKVVDKKDQEGATATTKSGESGTNQEINRDNQKIQQKSGIKQVPRSIPKLKPKTLNNRIPIRRIPFRAPKKGFAGFH